MTVSQAYQHNGDIRESPEFVRLSLAAAMTLGFTDGWFFRGAQLRCINLLLTYSDGCRANCAFCGLAREKEQQYSAKKFIRVPWKTVATDEVIERLKSAPPHVGRVCVSMITHPRCRADVLEICRRVAEETGIGVSLLISPTIMKEDDLKAMKEAGADRIGVAVDAAVPEIFERLRGKAVRGPHRWDRYWSIYEQSLEVFGQGMSGVHLIRGIGETEKELVHAISRAREMGGSTHLFSFFPERGSVMQDVEPPPMGSYRRIQLARRLIDHDRTRAHLMAFDDQDRIVDFGVSEEEEYATIRLGDAFETSGCPGPDGKVACNRPFGNERPGPDIRNFPFPPTADDVEKILREIREYE